jgi:peptide/nickel transport system permease protein
MTDDRNRRRGKEGPGASPGVDPPADPEAGVHDPVRDPGPVPGPDGAGAPAPGDAPGPDDPVSVPDGSTAGEPAGAGDHSGPSTPRPERDALDGAAEAGRYADSGSEARTARRPVTTTSVVLSAVLPGAGHLSAGMLARGVGLLVSWVALLGAAWLGRDTLMGPPAALDEWIAATTLVLALMAVWGLALRDLVRRRASSRAAVASAGQPPDEDSGDSQWAIAARHFRRNGLAMAGLVVVVLLYLVALLAPLIAPYDPIAQGNLVRDSYLGPHASHWLGTDQFARDMLSRIIYGARISLAIGFIAVAIAIVLGSLLGAIAGYLGGKLDALLMRFTDMVMAFPRLVLLIMIIALFDPTIGLIIAVLGLTQWPGTARLVRGEVLSLREQEYVQAARALGFGRSRIILRHLIPNVLAPVIVAATLGIGNTIVLEAGLSFLGLGVQPPTPSWGTLVADGRQNLIGAWWVATFPGLAIVVTVLAFNLVGDGLRDALDPRLRS